MVECCVTKAVVTHQIVGEPRLVNSGFNISVTQQAADDARGQSGTKWQ